MHLQPVVAAAAILVPGSYAFDSAVISKFTARSYQTTSNLKNVSTYVTLSRHQGQSPRASQSHILHRRKLGLNPIGFESTGVVYTTPITVGSETFDVIIDTGSSDTWIITKGAQCYGADGNLTSSGCDFGPQWDQKDCVPIPNQNFAINYGDSSRELLDAGPFCTIDTTLGGITVKNQQIAAVTIAGNYPPGASGLLGLAYPALTYGFSGTNASADDRATNQVPYSPIFTSMYQQGKTPPIFSLALSRPSSYYSNNGYLALGGLAPVFTIGDWGIANIETVAIDSPGGGYYPTTLPYPQYQFYTITPDALVWQKGSNLIPLANQWTAFPNPSGNLSFERQYILDSGAENLGLPPPIADGIASKFNPPATRMDSEGSYSGYAVECEAVAPWFGVNIGGVIFPIDKRDMIVDDGSGDCRTGTTDSSTGAPYVLGDVFMSNVLTVFDVGNGQMKFRSRGIY